ncbi:hypothetical protein TYRP_001554, partial [Tyrophagus putrescentiae]
KSWLQCNRPYPPLMFCGDCEGGTPFCGMRGCNIFDNSYPRTPLPSPFSKMGPSIKASVDPGRCSSKTSTVFRASLQQGPGTYSVCWGPTGAQYRPRLKPFMKDDALCPAGQKEISVGKKRRKFFSAVRRQREDSSVQRRAAKVEPPVKGNPVIIVQAS